jgi:hypothetical protein
VSRPAPPSGMPAPERASIDGREIDLDELAREVCRRYRAEFPDEEERYGDAGQAWCVHDNRHILNWAAGYVAGYVDLQRQLDWLAGVLHARRFPLDRLARDLEICAAVAVERELPRAAELAAALGGGAERMRTASR